MSEGIIFDIREFSVHDGPGGRITVFFKGCPLSCIWCHNPEGQSREPELMIKSVLCTHCGSCMRDRESSDFKLYGRNPSACPNNLISLCGRKTDARALARELIPYKDMLEATDGGVTFSGGEPLMQYEFLCECSDILRSEGINIALETCGFAKPDIFRNVAERTDYIMFDLKLADNAEHLKYTGCPNSVILENAEWLKKSGIPFVFRTPMIPGITDTPENLTALEELARGYQWEKLKYNSLAGAKYPMLGRKYQL